MVEEITGTVNGIIIDIKLDLFRVESIETLNLIGWGFFVALKKKVYYTMGVLYYTSGVVILIPVI
jgi:hypothetical protein